MTDTAPEWDRFWRYDRLSSFLSGPGSDNYGPAIASGWRRFFTTLPNKARIVDLCTGNGAVAVLAIEAARKAGKRFDVTGVDLADIRPTAFVSNSKPDLKRVRFIGRTPAEALPLPDRAADAVVSQFGIEYSDIARSLAEAIRILAPGGRLRLAIHAAEGAVARDTERSIADADFLLDDLDLIGSAASGISAAAALERGETSGPAATVDAQLRFGKFRDGLAALERRKSGAMDKAMLANVAANLSDAFATRHQNRPADIAARLAELAVQVADHRQRQRALLAAAHAIETVEAMAETLRANGFTVVEIGEQRDRGDLLAHVLEGTAP